MSASKTASQLQGSLSKLMGLQKPFVYKTKVAAEIAKQVYAKEGMSFPTGAQFSEAQQSMQKYLNLSTWKNLTIRDVAKGGIVAAEIYTFFLVGEIIGRRSLIGYNVTPAIEPEHH